MTTPESTGSSPTTSGGYVHRVRVFKEDRWPGQWLGMCSCRKGIRCNSKADAEAFLRREGCMDSAS